MPISIKRDCETRWSSKFEAVEALYTQLENVISALEQLKDGADENVDTRTDADSLLHVIFTFQFMVLLPFWMSVLKKINRIQKRLQDPKMNLKDAAADLNALKDIISIGREEFCMDALQEGVKRCENCNIEINRRIRRKKRMPGEVIPDAALDSKNEILLKL